MAPSMGQRRSVRHEALDPAGTHRRPGRGFFVLDLGRFLTLDARKAGQATFAGWTRPKRFDRNLVVIGAGSGGLVTQGGLRL